MNHSDDESPIARDGTKAPAVNPRKVIFWILVAFGFLVVGLIGGTILYAWRKDLAWTIPAACFVGYVVAFRRGMLIWDPQIDGSWRQYLWIRPAESGREERRTAAAREGSSRRPPRHELKVVR